MYNFDKDKDCIVKQVLLISVDLHSKKNISFNSNETIELSKFYNLPPFCSKQFRYKRNSNNDIMKKKHIYSLCSVIQWNNSDFEIHYGEALVRQKCERLLPVTSLVVVQASFPAVGRLSGAANTPSWGSVYYVSKLHCIFIESLLVKMDRWHRNVHFYNILIVFGFITFF